MESTVFDIPRRKTATRLFLSTDVRNDPEQTNNASTVDYVEFEAGNQAWELRFTNTVCL